MHQLSLLWKVAALPLAGLKPWSARAKGAFLKLLVLGLSRLYKG